MKNLILEYPLNVIGKNGKGIDHKRQDLCKYWQSYP